MISSNGSGDVSKVQQIIAKFNLKPHDEGGWFRETYRSRDLIPSCHVTGLSSADWSDFKMTLSASSSPRSAGSSAYFLLTTRGKHCFSTWHRLQDTDELWFHHFGDPVKLVLVQENGNLKTTDLGSTGHCSWPQVTILRNQWFAAYIDSVNPDGFALVGVTCFPAFDFDRFEIARPEHLRHGELHLAVRKRPNVVLGLFQNCERLKDERSNYECSSTSKNDEHSTNNENC